MKSNKARGWRVAWVVGELSVGPPMGVDPVGQIRLRIQNKQTNKHPKHWATRSKLPCLRTDHSSRRLGSNLWPLGRQSNTLLVSIVALIGKAQQHPTWWRDCHQSGETSENTFEAYLQCLSGSFSSLKTTQGIFRELLWPKITPLARGGIDISGLCWSNYWHLKYVDPSIQSVTTTPLGLMPIRARFH